MSEVTIECHRLIKTFGGVRAVDDLSVSFYAGQITALVGPNGAGKTTLFHLISGMVRPDAGEVSYRERRISNLAPWRIARMGIGRLFQDIRIFGHLTVEENILVAFPGQMGENALWAITRPVRVQRQERENIAKANRLLQRIGLEHEARTRAETLSYGQQKLIAIARLIATGADALLLDEPSAGISKENTQIQDILKHLANEGKIVVMIEHDYSIVQKIADQVYRMDAGKMTVLPTAAAKCPM